MERTILFTVAARNVLETTDRHTQRYTASEMAEVFTPEQVNKLNCGEAVQVNARTTAVDLLAFYDAHK